MRLWDLRGLIVFISTDASVMLSSFAETQGSFAREIGLFRNETMRSCGSFRLHFDGFIGNIELFCGEIGLFCERDRDLLK